MAKSAVGSQLQPELDRRQSCSGYGTCAGQAGDVRTLLWHVHMQRLSFKLHVCPLNGSYLQRFLRMHAQQQAAHGGVSTTQQG